MSGFLSGDLLLDVFAGTLRGLGLVGAANGKSSCAVSLPNRTLDPKMGSFNKKGGLLNPKPLGFTVAKIPWSLS